MFSLQFDDVLLHDDRMERGDGKTFAEVIIKRQQFCSLVLICLEVLSGVKIICAALSLSFRYYIIVTTMLIFFPHCSNFQTRNLTVICVRGKMRKDSGWNDNDLII